MINKKVIQSLGDKPMDRKDFLKYSGIILVGLLGFKTVLSVLNQTNPRLSETNKESSRGFGGGKYGV